MHQTKIDTHNAEAVCLCADCTKPPATQWRWFALRVAPGREFVAERILREDGFDVFVPLKHTEGRPSISRSQLSTGRMMYRKQRNIIARTRLPGYVFIGFDRPDVPWLNVMRFRMIIGVVTNNGEPYVLSERDMRRLGITSSRPIRYINNPVGKRKKRKRPNARITTGPYQGRDVRVVESDKDLDIFELFEPTGQRSE